MIGACRSALLTVYRWETMSACVGLGWFFHRYDGLNSVGSDDERKFPYGYSTFESIFSNWKSLLLRGLLFDLRLLGLRDRHLSIQYIISYPGK